MALREHLRVPQMLPWFERARDKRGERQRELDKQARLVAESMQNQPPRSTWADAMREQEREEHQRDEFKMSLAGFRMARADYDCYQL